MIEMLCNSEKFNSKSFYSILENFEICKLDINRIYRYIEKYIKENASGTVDKEVEEVLRLNLSRLRK